MTTDSSAIPYALVDPPEDAHRKAIDPERVGALADDIAAQGLLQPPGVRGPSPEGRYRVIWGHRRYLAIGLLRWPELPARVFPWDYDPLDARTAENFMQERLTPVEEAEIIKRYVDQGQSLAAIARKTRHSPAWVGARVRLLEWPEDVRAGVQEGALTLGVAELLAQIDHESYRASLIDEAARVGASVATVGVWLAHYGAERARIVTNHETIQEIAARRELWKIVTPCDYCGVDEAYETTRSFRLCASCSAELVEAIRTNGQPTAQH